jgi:hypothetical protein
LPEAAGRRAEEARRLERLLESQRAMEVNILVKGPLAQSAQNLALRIADHLRATEVHDGALRIGASGFVSPSSYLRTRSDVSQLTRDGKGTFGMVLPLSSS